MYVHIYQQKDRWHQVSSPARFVVPFSPSKRDRNPNPKNRSAAAHVHQQKATNRNHKTQKLDLPTSIPHLVTPLSPPQTPKPSLQTLSDALARGVTPLQPRRAHHGLIHHGLMLGAAAHATLTDVSAVPPELPAYRGLHLVVDGAVVGELLAAGLLFAAGLVEREGGLALALEVVVPVALRRVVSLWLAASVAVWQGVSLFVRGGLLLPRGPTACMGPPLRRSPS